MKLKEAQERIKPICGIPFGELFSDIDPEMAIVNKGKIGQMLELALGKKLDSGNIDFEDGELKTNKCDALGNPKETVFITQIATIIDDLIAEKPFEETHLYQKIRNYNVVFYKDKDPNVYNKALKHLVNETKKGKMFGE